MIKLTVLYDNEACPGFTGSWGFSALLETDNEILLFDTGWDGTLLLKHIEKIGIDPASISKLVLSHQHWDHIGGLPEILHANPGLTVYVPSSFSENLKREIKKRANLVEIKEAVEISNGIWSTGELGDKVKEQSLVLGTENGSYVLTGCAHPGIDAILDAAAQGSYTVRRGQVSATYRSRFVLIGSMNPEEGNLRPQILDRFGLRLIVKGLDNIDDRLEAYRRVHIYQKNPRQLSGLYSEVTNSISDEIQAARENLANVNLPDLVAHHAIHIIQQLGIDSLRAEITWFEAARAYTAADGRTEVTIDDLRMVAAMALRMRRSKFMLNYFTQQNEEEDEMKSKFSETEG